MKKLLLSAVLLAASCQKSNPVPKLLINVSFSNQTAQPINYPASCVPVQFTVGMFHYVCSGNDTICSFKVDSNGLLSWRSHPGHVVVLGGCSDQSLTIIQ